MLSDATCPHSDARSLVLPHAAIARLTSHDLLSHRRAALHAADRGGGRVGDGWARAHPAPTRHWEAAATPPAPQSPPIRGERN